MANIDLARARDLYHTEMGADPKDHDASMARRVEWEQVVVRPFLDELSERDPHQNVVSAFIMAQDLGSAVRADFMLEDGMGWEEALPFIGSYGRCDWVKRHIQSGDIPQEAVYPMLADLWRGSDPDDTDPWWTMMWADAWMANGQKYIRDGEVLRGNLLTVYRGQIGEGTLGISWSLQRSTADRFAMTGGGRMPRDGGIVLQAKVRRKNVYAYLTARGEAEVIAPPTALRDIYTIARVVSEPRGT